MEGVKVVIASGYDWAGLYVNEKLEAENHSIRQHDFIRLISKYKTFDSIEEVDISEDCLVEYGNCPVNLEDVF